MAFNPHPRWTEKKSNAVGWITQCFVAVCLHLPHLTSCKAMRWHGLWQETRQLRTYFRPFKGLDVSSAKDQVMESEDPCNKHLSSSAKQCNESQVRKAPSLYTLLKTLVQQLTDEKVWVWLRNVCVKKGQEEEEVQMWQAKDLGIFCICFQGAVTQALKVLL